MKRIKKNLAAAATLAPMLAAAQLACTMPNGVVITKNFGSCPADAIKIQAADGTLLPITPPRASKPPPAPVQRAATIKAQPAATTAKIEPSAYDYAQFICKAFKSVGATECKVDSSVFSTSYVDATFATSPGNAAIACKDAAATMRQQTKAFGSDKWVIRIYSPFSGNRPIATCDL